MEDAGWAVTVTADGGVSATFPEGQEEAYRSALTKCEADLGYDRPAEPMSQADAESYLDALEKAAECLRAEGYSVPVQPPRSDSITGLMSTAFDPHWDPYGDVASSPDKLSAAMSKCPVDW